MEKENSLEPERHMLANNWKEINGGTLEEALEEADKIIAEMKNQLEKMIKK